MLGCSVRVGRVLVGVLIGELICVLVGVLVIELVGRMLWSRFPLFPGHCSCLFLVPWKRCHGHHFLLIPLKFLLSLKGILLNFEILLFYFDYGRTLEKEKTPLSYWI